MGSVVEGVLVGEGDNLGHARYHFEWYEASFNGLMAIRQASRSLDLVCRSLDRCSSKLSSFPASKCCNHHSVWFPSPSAMIDDVLGRVLLMRID